MRYDHHIIFLTGTRVAHVWLHVAPQHQLLLVLLRHLLGAPHCFVHQLQHANRHLLGPVEQFKIINIKLQLSNLINFCILQLTCGGLMAFDLAYPSAACVLYSP